jgi:hypothetical protein
MGIHMPDVKFATSCSQLTIINRKLLHDRKLGQPVVMLVVNVNLLFLGLCH